MKYRITHKTLYNYNETVSLCHNEAHLIPRHTTYQTKLSSRLMVIPIPSIQENHLDIFGNTVSYFSIQSSHKELTVTTTSDIDAHHPGVIELPCYSPPWEKVRDQLAQNTDPTTLSLREFILESPFIPINDELYNFVLPSFPPHRPIIAAICDLMQRIYNQFSYDPSFTTIVTPLSEVLAHQRGVCQDFAHLMIGCLRRIGIAARYVSGYLETLPPPGQQKLQGSDASHAWLSVYIPQYGWIDFDPTNNQIPTNQHITTAWGRDYGDVTPLKGIIFGGGSHILTVSVDVERLSEK